MIKIKHSPPSILTGAILVLAISVTLKVQSVFAATHAAETSAQAAVAHGERHRHGPPSKGFYHTQRHEKPTSIDRHQATPRRYGPPSKGFRTWRSNPHTQSEVRGDNAADTKCRRRGPPGKFPWLRC